MNNQTAQMLDINVGDEIIGTKNMVLAKIHALSQLQQKDVSLSKSCPTKVCYYVNWSTMICLCIGEIYILIPIYIHTLIRL